MRWLLVSSLVFAACRSSHNVPIHAARRLAEGGSPSTVANVLSFGAVGDGVADDTVAIMSAVTSIQDTGGVVYFPPTSAFYSVTAQMRFQESLSHPFANISLEGAGYGSHVKATTNIGDSSGSLGMIVFRGLSNYSMQSPGIRKLRLSGFDESTVPCGPLISFANTTGGYVIDSYLDTSRNEGVYVNSGLDSQNFTILNTYATRIGGYGSASINDQRAAFNPIVNNLTMIGNHAFQVGTALEWAGTGAIFEGNTFEYCAENGGATFQVCASLQSTSGGARVTFAHNQIRYASQGISFASQSTGRTLIENTNLAIGLPSSASSMLVRGNYIYDGNTNAQNAAIYYGSGASGGAPAIIENNTIIAGPTNHWAYGILINDTTAATIVRDNTVIGAATSGPIFYNYQAANTTAQFIDNIVIGASATSAKRYNWRGTGFSADTFSGIDNGTILSAVQPSRIHHFAAPTKGTWSAGDVVINSAPSAGSAYGWICTTAGTPGMWRSYGSIY